MPRFVILRHELPPESARASHWDVMLEQGGALCTWACDALPGPDVTVQATRLADHRADYLEYEGPVSGNRGTVTRWDDGEYEVTCRSARHWIVQLAGRNLIGCLTLARADALAERWQLSFTPR